MKRFLIPLLLCCFSCRPEEDPAECSLTDINSKTFVGMVGLCNAMLSLQQDFKATALVVVNDSLLHIYIQSADPNVHFVHAMAAIAKCIEPEPNLYNHLLRNLHDNETIGQLGGGKYYLSLQLSVNPCLDNGRFEGILKV